MTAEARRLAGSNAGAAWTLAAAQAQVRDAYRHGSVGQAYSGAVWLASAAVWSGGSRTMAIAILMIGGFFIYPVTTLVCRALGSAGTIPSTNPLRTAGMAIPLVGPLMIPLVGAAALFDIRWFLPAFMIAMGAHYLPFAVLYGLRPFLYLGTSMWAAGLLIAWLVPEAAALGAWSTGIALLFFSVWAERAFRTDRHHG